MTPSRRSARVGLSSFFSAFGVLAAINGVLNTVYSEAIRTQGWPYLLLIFGLAVGYALGRTWPKNYASANVRLPPARITVRVGDLFEQTGDIVIGMTDTFDTKTPEIIQANSVQGQLLHREYRGDAASLDSDLAEALFEAKVVSVEARGSKAIGKLERYEVGTVATLGAPGRRRYCVAYSIMSNEPRAQSSADHLWHSLSSLWDAARKRGQGNPISLPIMGAGLARLSNSFSKTDLIQLCILSFIIASRETPVSDTLNIIVASRDARDVDFTTIKQLLSSATG